ncbi:MAG TPA: M14 family metallopeptidase [Usitatibacter sp.]|jgi:hypothetical protein|nr:M14 family metallopeptidase [Usitatibacter sp.]
MGRIREFLRGAGPAIERSSIRVGSMASGMAVELPFVAVRGGKPGATLWLHGQVHGDEINGMVAALRFVGALDPAVLSGNVVVTPTGNPQALDARRKRNPYDELDLDQSYPGSASGLISERLAFALMDEIRGTADLVLNLHTLNPLFDARPYAVYKVHAQGGVDEKRLLAFIAQFEPNVACRMDVGGKGELPGNIAGALDYQCLALGIPAFMVELGGGSRYEAEPVALAIRGFERVARAMGILGTGAAPEPRVVRRVTRRSWVTADHGGLFVAETPAGAAFDAGACLGRVMDLHARVVQEARLDQRGIAIAVRRDPVVHTGERLAFIANEWDEVPTEPIFERSRA